MSVFDLIWRRRVGRRCQSTRAFAEIVLLHPFESPVYAVGDVHGCLSLYRKIEALILRDAAAFASAPTIVLLGDMVDRGPQTAALIDHLLQPPPGAARRFCLMGNHEEMLLDYLAAPRSHADWLHAGGAETLSSYGLAIDPVTIDRLSGRRMLQSLAAHLPDRHLSYLRNLPHGLQVGPYLLAHAGADALAPITAQPVQALLWGTAGLLAPGGQTLVHGHHITPEPIWRRHCISIDTGAFATGHLTAVRLMYGLAPAVLTTQKDSAFRDLTLEQ